ncbi:SDR family oxidoreductase [Modestobacter muralis]|uniref:SDR family oxidoreductase n=1 Tax=Modestobacter muralis TaxID=1608614 RepID=A0A6P0EZL1_9ACTN|nr:SDR family oxidoreductase [Modestobacter muralis]NEK96373.1 SDR family oxidoreductase [Modestobacter muralis]NEN53273.1 SDR family oxidoreductase [Modestobacter muralis]
MTHPHTSPTGALTGQHVLVLGGTSGIGLATALAAAAEGATVTVVSSRAESVRRALESLPAGSTGRAVDLTDGAAVTEMVDDVAGSVGRIDHLVYTAGEPLTPMPLAELDGDRARSFFQLRFFGALSAVHAVLPHLSAAGSITLVTGTFGDRPGPGWAVPAAICGAMESLTRALALELAPVRVNVVRPGVTRSPLWQSLSDDDRAELYRQTAATVPLGRVGEVEDIAAAFLFCMTQSFASGSVVTVDGASVLA